MRNDILIRQETHKDFKEIISLILRSFSEGTDYSDGTDIIALVEEIRDSEYYIPELSFVAELDGKLVGHFLFSRFPLSSTPNGVHIDDREEKISLCLHLWLFMQITFIRELAPLCLHKALKKLEMQDIRGLQLRAIIIFIIVLDLKHLQSLIFIRQVGYR